MCEICRQHPCHPRCPNAEEDTQVFICSGCGDPIYEGEYYYDIMGEQFCEGCIASAKGVAEHDFD